MQGFVRVWGEGSGFRTTGSGLRTCGFLKPKGLKPQCTMHICMRMYVYVYIYMYIILIFINIIIFSNNIYIYIWYVCICIYIYIPPPRPGPRAPGPPLLPAVPHNRNQPTQTRGWRMIANDPSQCFFTGAENRIRAGTGAPLARRKEQHHILYGNEHVTMTLLLTSASNHTISL